MTDIELVIKIPEEKELIDRAIWYDVSDFDAEDLAIILKAIATATPLPKGHGRLIDADELIRQYNLDEATKYGNKNAKQQAHSYSTMMLYEIADMIDDAPTIIEADKGDTE